MVRGRVATSGGLGAVMELQKRSRDGHRKSLHSVVERCTAEPLFFELRDMINRAPFLRSLYFFLLGYYTSDHVVLQVRDGFVAAAHGPLACSSRSACPPNNYPSHSAWPRNCLNLT